MKVVDFIFVEGDQLPVFLPCPLDDLELNM